MPHPVADPTPPPHPRRWHRRLSRHTMGCLAWLLQLQFLVVNVIAQLAWPHDTAPYSLMSNAVSDLAAVSCGTVAGSGVYICSPLHVLMNVSLVTNGILMLVGALSFGVGHLTETTRLTTARALLALAGAGTVIVGLAPEDVALVPHVVGAGMMMVLGNLGFLLLGLLMRGDDWQLRVGRTRLGSIVTFFGVAGVVGTVALASILLSGYDGRYLGGGAVERVSIFSLVFGEIVAGFVALTLGPWRQRRRHHSALGYRRPNEVHDTDEQPAHTA
ncbi:hypothetical protein GCM10022198_08970 [Klugiella xanthotipulae]|uniref:Putative membrane protein n=1 Tax=Klugiella xanthotipulae TaxID=244735 RepID=A0A543I629_9MICO|nr:DUF998 domain-containing protein [Klugiella xanthotipulae]TQM66024.1 putative membrane protein [Klugiella xanthotipulae]